MAHMKKKGAMVMPKTPMLSLLEQQALAHEQERLAEQARLRTHRATLRKRDAQTFGHNLTQAMQAKGMSHSDLARAVWGTVVDTRGMRVARNRDRVGQYAKGAQLPELRTVKLLANALGTTEDALMDGVGTTEEGDEVLTTVAVDGAADRGQIQDAAKNWARAARALADGAATEQTRLHVSIELPVDFEALGEALKQVKMWFASLTVTLQAGRIYGEPKFTISTFHQTRAVESENQAAPDLRSQTREKEQLTQ